MLMLVAGIVSRFLGRRGNEWLCQQNATVIFWLRTLTGPHEYFNESTDPPVFRLLVVFL